MLFLLNGTRRAGVSREKFIEYIQQPMDPQEWELIREGIVSNLLFKTGEIPGMLVIIHAKDLAEAKRYAESTPIFKDGLLDFSIDPVNRFPHFD